MNYDPKLPRLSDLVGAPVNGAQLARMIGRDRSFVQRLRAGQILRDHSLIEPLADALHQDAAYIRRVVINDSRRERAQKGRAA